MRPALHVTFIAAGLFAAAAVSPSIAADELLVAPEWDPARATAIVEAARTAQRQGDLLAAEHLCYGYATIVDRSALAAYDAYADLLKAEQRTEEAAVRAPAATPRCAGPPSAARATSAARRRRLPCATPAATGGAAAPTRGVAPPRRRDAGAARPPTRTARRCRGRRARSRRPPR